MQLAFFITMTGVIIVCIATTVKIGDQTETDDKYVIQKIDGQGAIVGMYDKTEWTNQTFLSFQGIPFAESPKAELRFKPPVERAPWTGLLDATMYGRRCPVITSISQSDKENDDIDLEDCLNLCVYTRNLTANKPVMFYIYGGGFYNGTNIDHPPHYLLEEDIVLVVPNYRIGALGWLTTYTDNMPGNAPVMDVLLALQWVQKYIRFFGGDKTQVTVVGQSAGAVMTGILLLSPKVNENLFQRVIIQSGSVIANWAIKENPRQQVERVCNALNCEKCKSDSQFYKCLTDVSVLKLLQVTTNEDFRPVIGDLNGIIPEEPGKLVLNYNRSIPVMTGFTKHDGSFILATYYDTLKQMYGNLSLLSVRQFSKGLISQANDNTGLANNLLTKYIFEKETLNSNKHKSALSSYFDLTNILFMKSPMLTFASNLVGKRLANIYFYTFDYEGEFTRFGYEFGNEHYPFNGGVHHSNDNIYVYATHKLNARDTQVAETMIKLWTSFAKYGEPWIKNGPNIPPMQNENGPYFHINNEITTGTDILDELTATLDDVNSHLLDRPDIEF